MNENLAVIGVHVHFSFPGETGHREEEPGQGSAALYTWDSQALLAGGNGVKTRKTRAGQLSHTELIVPAFPPRGAAEPPCSKRTVSAEQHIHKVHQMEK